MAGRRGLSKREHERIRGVRPGTRCRCTPGLSGGAGRTHPLIYDFEAGAWHTAGMHSRIGCAVATPCYYVRLVHV